MKETRLERGDGIEIDNNMTGKVGLFVFKCGLQLTAFENSVN